MGVHSGILQSVQTKLDAISGAPPTDRRYDLQVFEGETVPLLLIAPGPEREKRAKITFKKDVWWDYPTLVCLVWPGNRTVNKDLDAFLDLQEAIRNTLFVPTLSDVVSVFDTEIEPQEISKFRAPEGSNFRVASWRIVYRSSEKGSY